MKNRLFTVILLLFLLVTLTGNAQAISTSSPDPKALVYVKLGPNGDMSRFAATQLPMYALLEDGLLTGADKKGQQAMLEAGLSFQVVDPDLQSGTFYLAETRSSRPAPDFGLYGQVLLTTTHGVLIRMDPSQVDAITQAGAELSMITLTPKPLPAPPTETLSPEVIVPDPFIQEMIDQVDSAQVNTYDRQLAGELPVWVDDAWYTITSRHTYSGTPIQKTTHYVGQHMAGLDLDVEYHVWNATTNPNVIGELPGLTNPDDIFIIGGHLDDVNNTPGADDNASGSVATLIAADILTQYQWGCTLRFAFWTGEEQGLLGSEVYAQRASQLGENIVGYLNLDMIAYNTIGSQPGIDLIYNPNMPLTHDLALLFSDVVDAYEINLIPDIRSSLSGGSDHSSFWNEGYTAILAIEDQGDFNPEYHGPGDTPANNDLAYFTNFVKASIGTYAHMSGCLIPSDMGSLDGHVTSAASGAFVEDASIVAQDSQGRSFSTTTDVNGYYTQTLVVDTYTVTASAYGYLPITIDGVEIITDTVTTRDFDLTLAPTYTVSGTVTESGSGLPLWATISFEGSPVTVSTDPDTGFYQAVLPQGNYTMQVIADLHQAENRPILMDHDQTQNFILVPLPCILLVDDDKNTPDMRSHYSAALNGLGVDYDVWDIVSQGDPDTSDLSGYRKVLWYTGAPSSGTFSPSNETSVATYLDNGGNFFLSSHEYLYEYGLTPFGQNYLHIGTFTNDVYQTQVTGQNVFAGLGPYTLSFHFNNWSDIVNPDNEAQVAFVGNHGNAAISYEDESFKTVFFGYPFEAINLLGDRQAVMGHALDFFGDCGPTVPVTQADFSWLPLTPSTGELVTFTGSSNGSEPITYTWDFGDGSNGTGMTAFHSYQESGDYTVVFTATNAYGGASAEHVVTVISVCEPVSGLDFTWLPAEPYNHRLITYTATASGTEPISFVWDFDDGSTDTGKVVEHSFVDAGTYTVELSATNACGPAQVESKDVLIFQQREFFLPLVNKD